MSASGANAVVHRLLTKTKKDASYTRNRGYAPPPARPAAHDASRLAAAPHSARLQPMRLAAGAPGWNGWMMAHQAMVILDETITQNNDLQSKWNM